jgi:hypothetical protein
MFAEEKPWSAGFPDQQFEKAEGRSSLQNEKSPPDFLGSSRDKSGLGVRHALFPVLTLGAKLAASFPTLFSTASGVFGLVAGPSSALLRLNFE